MPSVFIDGPAGRIEGRHHIATDPAAPVALVLHPNPQFGGNMNTLVVYTLFTVFQDAGFHVLRMNFRGVGKSDGEFTGGDGELADATAAWKWLKAQHPESSSAWLAGFSFGAWIGCQLAVWEPTLKGLIAVAPPVNKLDFQFLKAWPVPTLVLHGAADALVSEDAVRSFVEARNRAGDIKAGFVSIPGASHFFENGQDQLASAVSRWISTCR